MLTRGDSQRRPAESWGGIQHFGKLLKKLVSLRLGSLRNRALRGLEMPPQVWTLCASQRRRTRNPRSYHGDRANVAQVAGGGAISISLSLGGSRNKARRGKGAPPQVRIICALQWSCAPMSDTRDPPLFLLLHKDKLLIRHSAASGDHPQSLIIAFAYKRDVLRKSPFSGNFF